MSNPIEDGTTRTMPRTVSVARSLSVGIVVLIALAGFGLYQTLQKTKVTSADPKYDQSSVDRGWHLLIGIVIVFFVLLIALHVLSVFLLSAPRNGGRVVAWIVNGATVLCCGCGFGTGLLGQAGSNAPSTATNQSVRFSTDAVPGVYDLIIGLGATLAILSAIAVIVLLILPASSDYFRKPAAAVWTPPWAGGPPPEVNGPGLLDRPALPPGQPPYPPPPGQYPQPGQYPPPGQPPTQPPTQPPPSDPTGPSGQ